MLSSPLGRKLLGRARAARRVALVASLFVLAASLPFASAGAWQQDEAARRPEGSPRAAKGQANVIAGAEFVPGEVLVRFRTETAAETAEAVAMPLGVEVGLEMSIEQFDPSETVRGLRLAKVDPARTLEAVAELASRPDVLYAEPNYVRRKFALPNDPAFSNMWALRNTGQPIPLPKGGSAPGTPGVDIGAERAWDTTQGSEAVVVGVVDQGIDFNHPDLAENIWTNPSDDADLGFPGDVHGWDFYHNDATVFDNPQNRTGPSAPDSHGTHVAGTIGARGNNARGVTGINWRVKLMSLKILGDDEDPNDQPAPSNVGITVRAYGYARQMRALWRTSGGTRGANIRVLNNSFGGGGKSQAELDAILALAQEDILFVAAAGNDSTDNFTLPQYPASYNAPNLLAVAATDNNDQLADFSNFGARSVSLGAPGSAILSTTPGNTYAYFWGTSMATPHVSGAAALVCAAVPNINVSQLRGVLAFTGPRISALDGKTTTGRRLNVANAITSALEQDATPPSAPGNFRVTAQNGRSVTLAWTAPGDDGNAGAAADYDFFFVNPTTQARTFLPATLVPAAGGTQQSIVLDVPYINFSGTIQLRAYDNAGNTSTASVSVTVPVNSGSDPYTVTLSAATGLAAPTGASVVSGDDVYYPAPQLTPSGTYTLPGYKLPFTFPFYGQPKTKVTVSTNGTLYFSAPPLRDNGDANDVPSSVDAMQGQTMIAGLWDDIDINTSIRPDSGVYLSQPDANRIVFRWQGVTFLSPRVNVNMEIELRSDGTIQMRYGSNPRVFPVVGISGGEPDAYIIASHTREFVSPNQPISLSNAQTVTFAPRVSQQVYSISGSVRDANGAGVPNVTVFLSGSPNGTSPTMTNSNGEYQFANLSANLSYTVTPSHPNFRFEPASINIPSLTSNQGANFIAVSNAQTGANSIGFAQAAYQYGEGDGRATFTITRTGDTSGTATVNYRTTDSDTFTVGCGDTVNNNGGAFARCDFSTTVGSLSFVPGELTKLVTVPLVDDGRVEGAETFQLQLSNATGTGTTLGAQSVSTVTITDNDAPGAANPVVGSFPFFVRQQYLDFLSREPDTQGFNAWVGALNGCPNAFTGPGTPSQCDRIYVSGEGFFRSAEFQLKGSYVFRFYRVAFNRLPQYTEIVSDMSFVAGATEAEVYARKAQLANAFAARPEFQGTYGGMTNAQFVSALLARYGVSTITTPDPATPDSGTRSTFTAATLTNQLDANFLTRAQVFRAIADSDQVQAAEFNSAFVAVQYYGYLRRTPEPAGYQDNLNALQRGVSPREMINAFLNSTEYRLRFGQP
ncbi:MAG TPA: S8 family serine peptidase [Pyrinomonadaceae bacterium]|nr:S8 family serine peptidase [Pyrinomonadaceae bacterium]